jgi:hypothetical protein
LHLAAKFNKFEACQYLCKTVPELLKFKTKSGYSVLLCAVGFAGISLIKYLIENQHADIYSTSPSGRTIKYYVQNTPNNDVKEYVTNLFSPEKQ